MRSPSRSAPDCLLILLAAAVVATSAAEPQPGRPKKAVSHRIIVSYRSAGLHASTESHAEHRGHELERRVRELRAKAGVLHAQGLLHVGMVVAHCHSLEACERLVLELEQDPLVHAVTPDTLVHYDGGSARGARGDAGKQRPLQDLRPCDAQSGCAALGLVGQCCPAMDGMFLACCDGPTTQNLVAVRTKDARYVTILPNGTLRVDRRKVGELETFQLFHNLDGTVSLRNPHRQRYVSAEDDGRVHATRDLIFGQERFTMAHNDDGTVSLRAPSGRYFAFKFDDRLRADRRNPDYWTKFRLKLLGGPTQRFPNDANFTSLWGLHDQADKDIDAPEAWRTFTGEYSRGITVAVIDTGVDYTHEDLRENMWVNPGEIPGNGIDDDGNGYVDDVYGYDFANGDSDPMDEQMHGTHCAGVIAGVGNNRRGITGVAWRGARLMALKFLTSEGSGRTSDAVKAIDYAVAHGAKILSSSWGGGGSNAALRVAIERAEAAGVLFVAAAGNDGKDNDARPHYPSSYLVDSIIAVASTTHEGDLSGFSSYGATSVHVAAPGSLILSTVPGGYAPLSGTSMATPHVSGLAALVWMFRPSLSMAQVKEIILKSVTPSEKLNGKVLSGGRISAALALEAASAFAPPRPPVHPPRAVSFKDTDTKVGSIGGTITITAAADESDVGYYSVYFVSEAGFQLDHVGTVAASGKKELELTLNMSTVMPKFASGFVAVSGNASGEMPAQLGRHGVPNTTAEDLGVPEFGPQAVSWWGDSDLRAGYVAGTLQLTRAVDEASISHYNVYWSNASQANGQLLGSIPAVGFQEPRCTGPSCSAIAQTSISGGHRFDRRDYLDDEEATITASGPALLKVSRFSVEQEYDILTVGTYRMTGQLEVPFDMRLPTGQITIEWFSDESFTASGWTFDLLQAGRRTTLRINATKPSGSGLVVVPAYGRTELTQKGVFVKVPDRERGGRRRRRHRSSPAAGDGKQDEEAAEETEGEGGGAPAGPTSGPAAEADLEAAAGSRPAIVGGTSRGLPPREPWLHQRQAAWQERHTVWPTAGQASSASRRTSFVRASITVPGLDAAAIMPGLKIAFEEAISSGLPHMKESNVRVVRVLGARKEAAKAERPEAVVEFEVTPTSGDLVASLDRIEARLILLSKDGQGRASLRQALLASLAKAGVKLSESTRLDVSEPLQIGGGRGASPTRRLSGASDPSEETLLEDQAKEEEEDAAEGAGILAGASLAALLAAVALAVALITVGCQRHARSGIASADRSLEGVCVDVAGHGS